VYSSLDAVSSSILTETVRLNPHVIEKKYFIYTGLMAAE